MIILSEYGSAVFLARDKCRHKDRKNIVKLLPHKLIADITIVDGKEIKCKRPVPNPEYDPYKEGELERIRQEENEDMYEYLKERYPDKDYAERFKNENLV